MPIFIYQDFLIDLRNHADTRFAKRVLGKVLNPNGSFRADRDDHQYDGIEDAWIRYVSRQHTAWRAVYIRKGADVFLYRAGEHSIEDNLIAPRDSAQVVAVMAGNVVSPPESRSQTTTDDPERDRFLQNTRHRLLKHFFMGRRLIPHKEIILISPYLSLDLLMRTTRFGQMLDNSIEDGASITLATRWPRSEEIAQFEDLEARGFNLLFHRTLHAKLYIFEVRNTPAYFADQRFENVAVVGSANLTSEGLGFNERDFNEELCYELPAWAFDYTLEFAAQVAHQAADLKQVRHEYARKR